ncbi:MAG: hypothetical protein M8844_03315, partial [marine benthic group bacterium]|nr:hypothetical protein [Gemmatimonadota bacterium]
MRGHSLRFSTALIAGLMVLVASDSTIAQSSQETSETWFTAGGTVGYNTGLQVLAFGRAGDFAEGLPVD